MSVITNCDTTSVLRSHIPFSLDLNAPFNTPAGLKDERIIAGYRPDKTPKKIVTTTRKRTSSGDENNERSLSETCEKKWM